MASELIPTLEDLLGGDISQGNTRHPGSHFPRKLHFPTRSKLTGKILPLPSMPQWLHRGPRVLDGYRGLQGPIRRPNRTYNHAQCPKAWGPTSLRPCTRGVIVADFMDNGPLKGWGVTPRSTPLLGLFQDCLCGLYGLAWCNILSLLQLRKGLTLFHL